MPKKTSKIDATRKVYLGILKGGAFFLLIFILLFLLTKNRNGESLHFNLNEQNNRGEYEIQITHNKASNKVVVDYVFLEDPGFIVVYKIEDLMLGQILGNSKLLFAGEGYFIEIPLIRNTQSGETLFVALHKDDGDGVFGVPEPDEIVIDKNGSVVGVEFVVEGESEMVPRM